MRLEKVLETLKKYRLPALVVLAGVVLMLLPTGTKTDNAEDTAEDEGFSLTETEQRMAEVIDAVSVLTGLSSDKISVVKWKN